MKKNIAALLISVILLVGLGTTAFAKQGTISTADCSARAGQEITVDLTLSQNPGVIGLSVMAEYDSSVLELISYKNGAVFDKVYVTSQNITVNPYKVMWIYPLSSDITKTGKLVSFTFKVKNSAKVGSSTVVRIYSDDSTNDNFEIIDFGEAKITVDIVGNNENTNDSGNVGVEIQGTTSTPQTASSSTVGNSTNKGNSKVSGAQSDKGDNILSSTYVDNSSSSDTAESDSEIFKESDALGTDNGQNKSNPWVVVGTAAGVVSVVALITVIALILRKNKAKDTKEREE